MHGPGYFIKTVYLSLINYDIKALIIFAITNILIFLIVMYLFSKVYIKLIFTSKVNKVSDKKQISYKKEGKLNALLKKEFKLYISSPVYFVNTFFGIILIIVATVYVVFTKGIAIQNYLSSMNLEGTSNLSISYFILVVLSFAICTSNTACSSISIEGKRMWILKTIPVEINNIIRSKIIFNILVVAPISIVCVIFMCAFLKINIITMVFMCIFVFLLAYSISSFGMINNIKFPKLKWQNEAEVVKQSTSTFISTMVSMIAIMTLAGVFMALSTILGELLSIVIVDIALALICIILNRILYLSTVKKFYINC